jgi:hypothetical protein
MRPAACIAKTNDTIMPRSCRDFFLPENSLIRVALTGTMPRIVRNPISHQMSGENADAMAPAARTRTS